MRILLALIACLTTCLQAAPPNIIFIIADDLGWADVAFHGGNAPTPNLDKLAAEGLELTHHYVAPVCTPTRAGLMTGRYWSRFGITSPQSERGLPIDTVTLPRALKQIGYDTCLTGKWHLGSKPEWGPNHYGFDHAYGSLGGGVGPYNHRYKEGPYTHTWHRNGELIEEQGHVTDLITTEAIQWIEGRKKDTPFFLYLPHFGVHSPYQAKRKLIEKFKAKPGVAGHNDPVYAAMIASVDESVGRIMAKLDELNLSNNTVLIFTSDNGGVGGYEREGLMKKGGDVTDNTPLRSGKGSLYEGGTRVPFIVRWPGITKAGTTCGIPTIHVDLYPTLVEIAAAQAPTDQPQDGESLVPLFKDPASTLKRAAIFQNFPGYLGAGTNTWRTTPVATIINGDWKLMEFMEDKHLELYNLKDDIGETTNLASKQPDQAKTLLAKLHAWQTEIKAPMPTPNTPTEAPAKTKGGKKGQGKGKKKAAVE